MSYVIFSLVGDYSRVAEEIDKELNDREILGKESKIVDKLPVDDLKEIVKKLSKDSTRKEREISLMREELNELYLKYDAMCAAFGEMNHFIQEASKVPTRHSIES